MNLRPLLLTTLVLAAALAGCLAGEDAPDVNPNANAAAADPASPGDVPAADPTGNATDTTAVADAVHLTGCHEVESVFPFPAEAFHGVPPEGFAPATIDPAGTTTAVAIVAYNCPAANATTAAGLADVQEVWAFLLVDPPEAFEDPAIDLQLLPLAAWTNTPELAALYGAWGLAVSTEHALVEGLAQTPASRSAHAIAHNAAWGIRMHNTVGGDLVPTTVDRARVYIVGDAGDVTGALEVAVRDGVGMTNGVSVLAFDGDAPMPAPAEGIAFQYWGDDYGYDFTYATVEEMTAQAE